MTSDPPLQRRRLTSSPPPPAEPPLAAAANDTAPTRIGARYHVLEQLGRGGMAVVYRVRDGSSTRELALKQLLVSGDAARDRETHALFEREFYTLAQLKHPSVIEVYDYGVTDTGPYYTMELLTGGDLSTRSPLDYREACDVMIQVCSSLSLLHSRRWLHRDLSPRNIRCTSDGRAKLIDFGAMVPLGSTGPTVGTPAFVAPEVVHHVTLDARADLFSLGATLYYALTGRPPYPAHLFSDLRDAWSRDPLPPGQIVTGIPPALDALLMSLLSIDPGRRPRSAFEVMQRLAAITGRSTEIESDAISQAYLATPALVARDVEQQRVRSRLRRALAGQGGALAFESAPGVGRSRMLDACMLDAKTLGATVLRISGRGAMTRKFESVRALAAQLLEALPEVALRGARESGALRVLFAPAGQDDSSIAPRLFRASEITGERETVQSALTNWFAHVAREKPLLIAVDDVERVDEPSLGTLAELAVSTNNRKLLIAIAVQSPITKGAQPALDVLRAQCMGITLAPFGPPETERFFSALFGNVPEVALVADRIHKIAAGNPRESMTLAQYLVDLQLIRYSDGQWILPAELSVTDLPANVEDALRARLAALPPLARRLAQTQALARRFQAAFTRADYAELVSPAEHAGLDAALDVLLQQGIVVSEGRVYTLAHQAMRSCLIGQLSEDERNARHRALAALTRSKYGKLSLVSSYHMLQAGETHATLDEIRELIEAFSDRIDFYDETRMEASDIAATFQQAFELVRSTGRRKREAHELARHLIALSVATDNALFDQYAPGILEQLELDSGLSAFRATPAELPVAERLQTALNQTVARYTATPEFERVYRVDEAIKFLARYVTIGIVIGVRSRDSKLLDSLPGMLEPFAGLSPILHALWQNLISATEMNYLARPLEARARALDVYENLGKASAGENQIFVDTIRHAVCYALGVIELSLGYQSATQWIGRLDQDRMQRVNAMRLRSFQSMYEGDAEQAERFRTQAEVLAVQASSRQMFDSPLVVELGAHYHASDLSGVKHSADRIAQRAASHPRWRAAAFLAQGLYQRLRGDSAAAHEAFQQSIALDGPHRTDAPPWLDTWRMAVAGEIPTLVELGRPEEARSLGLQAVADAERLGLGPWACDMIRELALAEARLGDHARAAQRLDALIATRQNVLPSHLAADYEARACVAIWAKDSVAAAQFAGLAVQHDRGGHHASQLARKSRLLDVARIAGQDMTMSPTDFESAVLGPTRIGVRHTAQTRVTTALKLDEPNERAQKALELLCEAAHAQTGRLYLVRNENLERAATLGGPVDPSLDGFAYAYWMDQLEEELATSIAISGTDSRELDDASWTSPGGQEYRFLLLKCPADGLLRYVGLVALLVGDTRVWPAMYWELASAVSTRLLDLGDVRGVSP